jgi:hypothetical protein
VDIVRVNARRAVDALSSHWGHIEKALPLLAIPPLLKIPALALALSFGANKGQTMAIGCSERWCRKARYRKKKGVPTKHGPGTDCGQN